MINKLTGKTVSKEMLQVIARLEQNRDVTLEDIHALPEMKEAYEYESQVKSPEISIELKDKLHYGIYRQLADNGSVLLDEHGKEVYTGEVGKDKRLDLVIGLPASGKSSNLVIPLSQQNRSRIVDSDMAKELLPGYENGWGAGYVHQESKDIIETVFNAALKVGDNIVYPVVGSNLEKIDILIQKAEKFGYSINVHYAEIEPNRALGRMLNRFLETGRFLKPELIYTYGNKVKETYEVLKGECKYNEIRRTEPRSSDKFGEILLERGNGRRSGQIVRIQGTTEESISGRISYNDRRRTVHVSPEENERSWLPAIAGYSKWNMDVPKGEYPILLETNCHGKLFDEAIKRQEMKKMAVGEITKNHFEPTPKMVNAYAAIATMGSKSVSFRDISMLYKNLDLANPNIREHIQTIGDECKRQELLKQQSKER